MEEMDRMVRSMKEAAQQRACPACGASVTAGDARWRFNGATWEHTCQHPQAGHFPAEVVAFPAPLVAPAAEEPLVLSSDPQDYLTAAQVATILGISVREARSLVIEEKVQGYKPLGHRQKGWRLHIGSLRAYLASIAEDRGVSLARLDRALAEMGRA